MASPEEEQIKQVVLDFLKTADMSTTTERKVLAHVQQTLQLSKPPSEYKRLVSSTIDEFLTSLPDEGDAEDEDGGGHGGDEDYEPEVEDASARPAKGQGRKRAAAQAGSSGGGAAAKKSRGGGDGGGDEVLFSRDLSGRRKARVRRWEGKLYVDVREFFEGADGEAPTHKGLSMDPGQWARLARELPRLLEAQRGGDTSAPPAQLGKNRMAAVSEFKGVHYLGLREYYEKDGKLLPGKKGVSLTAAEVSLLLAAASDITAAAGGPVEPPPLEPAGQPRAGGGGDAGTSVGGRRGDAAARAGGGVEGGEKGEKDYVDLGGSKRVSISRFGGRLSVDLREWYEKDGTMHPGKKGIALSPADWAALAAAVGDVSSALARKDMRYALQLSGKRRVNLSDFRGVHYVAVREYYDKGGELAPTQKGLNMNPAQWAAFVAGAPAMTAALQAAQEGGR